MTRFETPQLAEVPFSSIAYSSDRQIFIRMTPSPFFIVVIFPGGKRRHFLILFTLLTMKYTRTFIKRFTLSTQREIAPFYGNSQTIFASFAVIAR